MIEYKEEQLKRLATFRYLYLKNHFNVKNKVIKFL